MNPRDRKVGALALAAGVAGALALAACEPVAPTAPPAEASRVVAVETAEPEVAVAPEPGRCDRTRPARLVARSKGEASSEIALARGSNGEDVALVADEDARALFTVDASTLETLAVTELPGRPKHVRVLGDGRVAVSLGDVAKVVVLEPASALEQPLEIRCEAFVAAEPWSIAERGTDLVVTSGFGAALTVFETVSLTPSRVVRLPREPRAVVVDGSTAYVAHAVGGEVSEIDLASSKSARVVVDLRAGRVLDDVLPREKRPRREAVQAYALVASRTDDRLRLFVPHASVDTGKLTEPIAVGYGGTLRRARAIASSVAVIDAAASAALPREVSNERQNAQPRDCLLPRGAALARGTLYVACADIDEVVGYDATVSDPATVPTRHVPAPPQPSSLAIDGDRMFVWSAFARELRRVDLQTGEARSMVPWTRAAASPDPVLDAKIRRGRYLFSSSMEVRIADGRACASCHPEGRDDGLVWSSPDGRRQTPMLASRIEGTAPYGWFGEHDALVTHVRQTVERLDGTGFLKDTDGADRDALLAFVRSLNLPSAPPASGEGGGERVAALGERGRAVFESVGCAQCHADGGTDASRHDVGSGVAGERTAKFDTPSLRGVAGSAPYFHDGRYASLDDLLRDPESKMFLQGRLDDDDRAALRAYLETL